MGETTNIAWTDATWNCVIGCSHVSPGCEHCYAETLANRYGWTKKPWGAQHAAENVQLRPKRLAEPLKWKQPKRVFANSLSDLFHEQVPFDYIDQVFGVMKLAYWHNFQVLTKRPQRMLEYFAYRGTVDPTYLRVDFAAQQLAKPSKGKILVDAIHHYAEQDEDPEGFIANGDLVGLWPLPNVWLGVSVEDQRRADERIPLLIRTPAAVRFLSCEPLLGPLEISRYLGSTLTDLIEWENPAYQTLPWPVMDGVDWVIVGGESGPRFRPMDLDWARSIRDQCRAANVAFFYKQSSGLRSGMNPILDGQTWQQFPLEANRA